MDITAVFIKYIADTCVTRIYKNGWLNQILYPQAFTDYNFSFTAHNNIISIWSIYWSLYTDV